jgi:phosphate transport system substrate-binding protein
MLRKTLVAAVALVAVASAAQARDQIRIVGSSTVYPFSTAVAEQFGKTSGFKTPVVESTGTGCRREQPGHRQCLAAHRAVRGQGLRR